MAGSHCAACPPITPNGVTCEHDSAAISRLCYYKYASLVLMAEHARNLHSSELRRFSYRTRFCMLTRSAQRDASW
jgi:hypothetical protein